MAPWLLALVTGNRKLVSQTVSASTVYTTPYGVTTLASLSGQGAAGTPGTAAYDDPSTTTTSNDKTETWYYRRSDGGPDDVTTVTTHNAWSGTQPDNTSDTQPVSDGVHYEVTYIVIYSTNTTTTPGTHHDGVSPTTGASAFGFGKTFPGGTGGAASVTSFTNVAVTENTAYTLTVPSGGSITFTYYR